jgi:leucine dehydrogenase
VGCGHVGERLARRLAAAGARLLLADVDERKRSLAAELPGAAWAKPDAALLADVDVLAPCALGGVLDNDTAPRVQARVVCGAANNQLAGDGIAGDLAARGVLYAPDFLVNAGGLINVAAELEPGGYDAERTATRVAEIEDAMAAVLAEAAADGTTPLAAAIRRARRRLDAAA